MTLLQGRVPHSQFLGGEPRRDAAAQGRAVQLDPIKPTLKTSGTKRSKLKYIRLLSMSLQINFNFNFNFTLRRYIKLKRQRQEDKSASLLAAVAGGSSSPPELER